jgi:hypothetical protein
LQLLHQEFSEMENAARKFKFCTKKKKKITESGAKIQKNTPNEPKSAQTKVRLMNDCQQ